MEKIIAYDADWQTPAKTEKYVFDCLGGSEGSIEGVVYIAFPWANLIDGLARETDLGSRLLKEYEKICSQAKNTPSVRKVTVCQHIKFKDYAHLFKGAGITDLFVSHKEKAQTNLGAINLYPLQLFPVQATHDVREELGIPERKMEWHERPHPYSFVGAYDGRYYLTESRKNIFEELADKGGLVTERMSWHYQARVYDQQVYGKELSEDYLTEEQKNAVEYINVLQSSKFSLCPSGTGPNSIRLWESIEYGAIPIILADTLDLPGDVALWREACVFVDERKDAIRDIPTVIDKILSDKKLYLKKLKALGKLKSTLGLTNFACHITETLGSILKNRTVNPKIVLDCSKISSSEELDWAVLLSNINRLQNDRFDIQLVKSERDKSEVESGFSKIEKLTTDFSKNFAVIFDSKTITNALLKNFETIIINPQTGPHALNKNLLPLLDTAQIACSSEYTEWLPICTLVTSMFNGDDYKNDFLNNTAKFERLDDIELLIFRPESRGFEHFDLLTFGAQNSSLVYIWLAEDPGLYDVWNFGTRLSAAKYISNANIDDKRGPKHISAMVDALDTNKQCSVGSTALRVTDTKNLSWEESKDEMVWYKPKTSEVYQVNKISKFSNELGVMQAHNIPHCMPVWRAKLHRMFGYFEERRFGPSSDWEFWLRCGIQGTNFYLLNEDHGLYYRAPQSYWRRDPNAKNYDFIIANEHFSGATPRARSLSHTVVAFELDRLLKYFAAGDLYTGMANLFSFIHKKQDELAKAELTLLNKLCEIYLSVNVNTVIDALNRLSPVMDTKDTLVDAIGFCLRSSNCLTVSIFQNYMLLADKIAVNESEQLGWLVKAKLYDLLENSDLEAKCLVSAYNIEPYDFWCNINRLYGLEKTLSSFIDLLSSKTNVPKMCDFSWLTPGKKLYFLPDYSHGNPYQGLLYQNINKAGVEAIGLTEQESIELDTSRFERGDVLHIHWINVLFKGHNAKTIEPVLDAFLDKLQGLKDKGVVIVWTVHNRQNHETIDLNLELNFRRQLSALCNVVILHHPMIQFELEKWLSAESSLEILEHGLYKDFYEDSIKRVDAREQLKVGLNELVFTTLGQVRDYKAVPEKITLFEEVSDNNLRYIVAGKISCAKTLAASNRSEKIEIKNSFIEDNIIQAYMRATDFILLSYHDILTSGSFFQAMTFSVPVLAPELGSLNYYVCDGVNGYTYSNATSLGKSLKVINDIRGLHFTISEKTIFSDWPALTELEQ